MRAAEIIITNELLTAALSLPEHAVVVGARLDTATMTVVLTIHDRELPEVSEGQDAPTFRVDLSRTQLPCGCDEVTWKWRVPAND